jgi:riboflavin biosynthesis pyrimidine reductase
MTPALAEARVGLSSLPRLQPLIQDRPATHSAGVRGLDMPRELERAYGGSLLVPLHPDRPTTVANFASTLDGVVAFGSGSLAGGGLVSGFHGPDRFVMGLLRALADVVVVGAGTLRGSTSQRWIAEHIYPAAGPAYGEWRDAMGIARRPTTLLVTASGEIPAQHPGLNDPQIPVVVATTRAGAVHLRDAPLAAHVSVRPLGDGGALAGDDILAVAASLGARLVLHEGGPHLLSEIVRADLLDELFLTLAPQLVGRGEQARLALVEGVALDPADGRWHELVSVHRSDEHLFLRYRRRRTPRNVGE